LPLRFSLRRREAPLRRFVPEQRLTGFDLAAEFAAVRVWVRYQARPIVPRQVILAGRSDRKENGFRSVCLQVLPEADVHVHRPEL
jgi:hypothetical protein